MGLQHPAWSIARGGAIARCNEDGSITVAPLAGQAIAASGPLNVTPGQSTTAFTVARTGTSYAFQVDTNTAVSVTGLKVTAAAAGGGVALAAIGGNAAEDISLNAKGAGVVRLASVSTGGVAVVAPNTVLSILSADDTKYTGIQLGRLSALVSLGVGILGSWLTDSAAVDLSVRFEDASGVARFGYGAGSATAIALSSGGITFGKQANYTVSVATSTTAATAGGNLSVLSGAGATSGAGGTLALTGGQGGATGAGGPITITTGAGGSTSGLSGALTIATGTTAAESVSASGAITIQSGLGSNSTGATNGGASGTVTVRTQNGGTTGTGTGGVAGNIAITGGVGGNATGAGTSGNGGSITLTAGAPGTTVGGSNGSGGTIQLIGSGASGATTTLKVERTNLPFLSVTNVATGVAGNLVQINMLGSASASTQVSLAINPTWTQSGTAAYTALLVNVTESSTGSGAKLLADYQIGSSSKWKVTNAGTVTQTGSIVCAGGSGSLVDGTVTGAGLKYKISYTGVATGGIGMDANGNVGVYVDDGATSLVVGVDAPANSLVIATVTGLATFGGGIALAEAKDIAVGTVTGTKIGTATSQKLSLWNAAPNIQPTTGITAAAFVANTSLIANDTATFDGYTIGQVVAALRRLGALA